MNKAVMVILIILSLGLLTLGATNRALSGTYYINHTGGTNTYQTFTAAISALNTEGVGTGGVTFNVAAGTAYTENCPAITATGTSANPIVFQKSGEGANPVIYAGVGTGSNDAIVTLTGADYLIWDGIDLCDSVGNANTTTTAEYGVYIKAASATNGAQYNIFRNFKIVLKNTVNASTKGIYQYYTQTPTNAAGANSYNEYAYITIENSVSGIYLNGISNACYDVNTIVRYCTIGSAVADNMGGAVTSHGIYLCYQWSVNVCNNEIRNLTSTVGNVYGIYSDVGGSSINNKFYNNKIHDLKVTNTSVSYSAYGMYFSQRTTGTNVLYVFNNMISGLIHTYAGSATTSYLAYGIYVASGGATNTYSIDFNSIRIDGSTFASSACVYWASSGGINKLRNNILANFSEGNATSYHVSLYSPLTTNIGATGSLSNCNVLYIDQPLGGYIVRAGTTNYNIIYGIGSWYAASGQDIGSNIINPQFISASDLHINPLAFTRVESGGSLFNGEITWVTADIDGENRADEVIQPSFYYTGLDIGADDGWFIGIPPLYSPSSFTATLFNSNQINLSTTANIFNDRILIAWSTDNVFGDLIYGTYLAGDAVPGGGIVLYAGQASGILNHTGLNNGTTYYYRIWSLRDVEIRVYSDDYLAASVSIPPLYPLAPTNTDISRSNNDINISWDAVTQSTTGQPINVNYYIIYKSTNGIAYDLLNYTKNGVTTFTDVNGALSNTGFYTIIGFSGTLTELTNFVENHQVYPFDRGSVRIKQGE